MSFFDRIGNLGKGLVQSALSGDTSASTSDSDGSTAGQQDRLRQAFEQGRLSAEEYRERLLTLSERLTQLRSDRGGSSSSSLDREPPLPDLSTTPAAPRTAPARPADPTVEDRRWEDQEPVKRTL